MGILPGVQDMTFYEFMSDSPYLSFGIALLFLFLMDTIIIHISIWIRGYPPPKVCKCSEEIDPKKDYEN